MRPVLVGMNNPLSPDPRHALVPYPVGCAGYRLWQMLNERCGAFREEYVTTFDRRNVLSAQKWNAEQARRGAQELAPRLAGRRVVLLGSDTVKSFGLDAPPPLVWQTGGGIWAQWCRAPHPSGRNLWFNVEAHRFATGLLLEELLVLYRAEVAGVDNGLRGQKYSQRMGARRGAVDDVQGLHRARLRLRHVREVRG